MSPALTARQLRATKHQKTADRELEQLNGGAATKHASHGSHSGDPTRGLREHLAKQQHGDGIKDVHRNVKRHFERHGDKYKAAGAALAALGTVGAIAKGSRDPASRARVAGAVGQAKQVVETGAQLGTAALDTAAEA